MTDSKPEPVIPRDAATLILLRRDGDQPRILMGQRSAGHTFMPNKYVFPGGAIDPDDKLLQPAMNLREECLRALATKSDPKLSVPLALSAIRETFEETGLAIGHKVEKTASEQKPKAWEGFYARDLEPALDKLQFVFRAITPPSLPKRFDARFFLADAELIDGDPDDFTGATDELHHLSWVSLAEARALELPFITSVVLAEIEAHIQSDMPRPVPFFAHDGGRSTFEAL